MLAQTAAPGTSPPPRAQTPTAPAPQVAPPPQAHSQPEFEAYQAAIDQTTAAAMEEAANKFVTAYRQSELRPLLLQHLLERFFKERNAEKTIATAHELLQLEPDNPVALVRSAAMLAETTGESDLNHNERLMEAQKNAQRLVNTVDRSIATLFNPNAPAEQVEATRKNLLVMAYSALGKADLDLKQYAQAEEALKQALKLFPANAQNLYRLALSLDYQNRYSDALDAVNRSLENAQSTPAIVERAQRERERLQQLTQGSAAPRR